MQIERIAIAHAFLLLALSSWSTNAFPNLAVCSTLLEESSPPISKPTDLYFTERVGKVEEHSIRRGLTAAHIYLDSTKDPYLIVAFPAGNSGVSFWGKSNGQTMLSALSRPQQIFRENGLSGVKFEVATGAKSYLIKDYVLGSMRFIRDRELGAKVPFEMLNHHVQILGNKIIIRKPSLNTKSQYVLEIEGITDTRVVQTPEGIRLESDREVQFQVSAFSSETPLTPIPLEKIFKKEFLAQMPRQSRDALSFLIYREKIAAGSPRYLSQFGRDLNYTLWVWSQRGLLTSEGEELFLSQTLRRIDPRKGITSHEESEGDFATYVRLKQHRKYRGVDKSTQDRKMVDADFAFAINMADYLKRNPSRSQTFLDQVDGRGFSYRQLAIKNFQYVEKITKRFTETPSYQNLIGLKTHESTGQWRDSDDGLGGGVYPFDVNAAFVPAALKALHNLYSTKGSEFENIKKADFMKHAFDIWNSRVIPLFMVRVPVEELRTLGEKYFHELGINPEELPQTPSEDLLFPAISLDAKGQRVKMMHSDDSIMLAFGYPSPEYLRTLHQRIQYQFPYGLNVQSGILVANPIFGSTELKQKYSEYGYHQKVDWAMQEQLLDFGINRQVQTQDLSAELQDSLVKSKQQIRYMITSKESMGGTEVFAVHYQNGKYELTPFAGDAKSNSNQFWSYLGLWTH